MSTIVRGSPTPLFDRLAADGEARLPGDDALRASIARDLARLVNTRSRLTFEAFEQSDGSVLDYGVPDFAGRSLVSGPDRERIEAAFARAISLFESRVTDVSVKFAPSSGPARRPLIQVRARLRAAAATDHVAFELAPGELAVADPRWTESG